ncbi:MAG: hypothetical protein HFE77_02440 [Clostridiales bacterium]|nr:hypothetical protein [Clostridiales bacterium]
MKATKILSVLLAIVMLAGFSVLPISADDAPKYTQMVVDWETMADSTDMLATLINSEAIELTAGSKLNIVGTNGATEGTAPIDIHKIIETTTAEDGTVSSTDYIYNGTKDPGRGPYTEPYPYGVRAIKYANTWAAGYTVEISGLAEGETTSVTVSERYCRTHYKGNNDFWPLPYTPHTATQEVSNGVYTFLVNAYLDASASNNAWNRMYLYYLSDFDLSFDKDVTVKVLSVNEALTDVVFDEAGDYKDTNTKDAFLEVIQDVIFTSVSTVTYHDFDGEEIGTQTFEEATAGYGPITTDVIPIAVPKLEKTLDDWKIDTEGKHWCFGGWSTKPNDEQVTVSHVLGTLDLYPVWVEDTRDYVTITFKNDDDSNESSIQVPPGTAIAEFVPTPEKESTAQNSFDFDKWIDAKGAEVDFTNVIAEENATYVAKYIATERRYDVIFIDEDKETELDKVRVTSGSAAAASETPTKDATAQYTYTFDTWVDENGAEVTLNNITTDIIVYASYTAILNKYTVTFMTDGDGPTKIGEATVDYGTKAEIAAPTKGKTKDYTYTFDKWVDENGEAVDLNEVKENITVYASFTAEFTKFIDLAGEWYENAVEYVYVKGLMLGTSDTMFEPEETCTRGMLAAILYREEDSPSVEGLKKQFTDVPEGKYYYDAILWAYNEGVVYGINKENTLFAPEEKINREDMATMLYRYASKVKEYDVSYSQRTSFSKFEDRNLISEHAQVPLKYALDTGFISGSKDRGILNMNPQKGTTRAEMASMLMRFLEAEHQPAI